MTDEIKHDIAHYFLSDSRQFLIRYEHLKHMQTEISNRSKLLIDIVFALECSFKALIFLESRLDEKDTYKIIRKCGHRLDLLIKEVNSTPISDIVSVIDDHFEHLSISSRYTLEANIHFRTDNGILSEKYYSTIANPNWLDTFYENAKQLQSYVTSMTNKNLTSVSLADINIDRELEKSNRMRNLQNNRK